MNATAPSLSVLALVLVSVASVPAAEGDVQAFVDRKGTLIVRGDDLGNDVFVGRTGENNEFRVVGEGTTTVNGGASAILAADGVSIFLRGGDDQVQVDGNIPGDVEVEGGGGDDRIVFGDPAIEGSAVMSGGEGDDFLTADDTLVRGGLRMRGGVGADTLQTGFVSIHVKLVVEGGPGADDVQLFQTVVRGFLRVDAGSGDDVVRALSETSVDERAVIVMSSGEDEALLDECAFGSSLLVALGSGDDAASVSRTSVAGPASFHGGPSTDSYVDGGGNDFAAGPPNVQGFETVLEP